ncbi:MAG TPA: VOC family protein [Candidatus Limnocylindria bacterium]|nr:VOC family protein [Candidatus Limnocylindria bacterium]
MVLNVRDVDRSLGFYAGGLGLAVERLAEFHRGEAPFPSVRVNGQTIIDLFPPALHAPTAPSGVNLHHLCLVVTETIDELRAQLDEIGAPIDEGPVRVFGARGIGTSYYTRDPDGNGVELRTYREAE